jgi:hypothetical protein
MSEESVARDEQGRILCRRCKRPIAGKVDYDYIVANEAQLDNLWTRIKYANTFCQCESVVPMLFTSRKQPPNLKWYDKHEH